MKRDPYSDLGGLDQRLFQEDKNPTKQRTNETTLPRNSERANERTNVVGNDASSDRSGEGTPERKSAPTAERTSEATRTRASSLSGHLPRVRTAERHSHDLFQDQVRWMNRLKLDLEEQYGSRVTGNAIVQLAIDIIRDDFDRNGEQSNLVRVLVRGKPWKRRTAAEEGGG